MKIESGYVVLRDVRLHAAHGVAPQETVVGADFIVDLRIGCDLSRAVASDDVADTISYADVYEVLKREMEVPSRLVEHVACRVGKALFQAFPAIHSVDIRITKVNPPMGACCLGAGVELHLINDKTR